MLKRLLSHHLQGMLKQSEYEKWLENHEPLLRSIGENRGDELVFPQPMVWVVDVNQGNLDDLLQSIRSIDRGKLSKTAYVVVDDIGFFDGKSGEWIKQALLATGVVETCISTELNRVLGGHGADSWVGFLREG